MGRTHTSTSGPVYEDNEIISQGAENRGRGGVRVEHYGTKNVGLAEISQQLKSGGSFNAKRWADPAQKAVEKGLRPITPHK